MSDSFWTRMFLAYARGPNHPAKLRVIDWIGSYLIPDRGFVSTIGMGFTMRLNIWDHLERCLVMRNTYEPLTSRFVAANCHRGNCAVVAGANVGYYPLLIASRMFGTGQVLGVEPVPDTILHCQSNLELNPDLRKLIHLFEGAVGKEEQAGYISYPPPEHSGLAHICDNSPGSIPIQIKSLPAILHQYACPQPGLMVLDVEGYEQNVLEGLTGALPNILVMENDPGNQQAFGSSEVELFSALRNLGYSTHHLDGKPALSGDFFPEQTVIGCQPGVTPIWNTIEP